MGDFGCHACAQPGRGTDNRTLLRRSARRTNKGTMTARRHFSGGQGFTREGQFVSTITGAGAGDSIGTGTRNF